MDASTDPAAPPSSEGVAPDARIELGDDASVTRWTTHFGITISQLEEAVQAAGPRVADVERLLREQGASAGAG
jgi:hypothetical protein